MAEHIAIAFLYLSLLINNERTIHLQDANISFHQSPKILTTKGEGFQTGVLYPVQKIVHALQ